MACHVAQRCYIRDNRVRFPTALIEVPGHASEVPLRERMRREKESRLQARLREFLILPHPIRPANATRVTRLSQGTGRAGLRDPM